MYENLRIRFEKMGQRRPASFCLFLLFSTRILEKNFGRQRDMNSDRRSKGHLTNTTTQMLNIDINKTNTIMA